VALNISNATFPFIETRFNSTMKHQAPQTREWERFYLETILTVPQSETFKQSRTTGQGLQENPQRSFSQFPDPRGPGIEIISPETNSHNSPIRGSQKFKRHGPGSVKKISKNPSKLSLQSACGAQHFQCDVSIYRDSI
jgi:hypothetical protein